MSSIIKCRNVINGVPIKLMDVPSVAAQQPVGGEEEALFLADLEKEMDHYKAIAKEEAMKQAEVLVSQAEVKAQQQADAILAAAYKRAKEVEIAAEHKCEALLADAEAQVAHRMQVAMEEQENLLAQGQQEKQAMIQEAEPAVVTLVQELVAHIIHGEVVGNTRWVELLVKKTMEKEKVEGTVVVCVNAAIYETLVASESKLLATEGIRVEVDSTLADTQCVVETEQGGIAYNPIEALDKMLAELTLLTSL